MFQALHWRVTDLLAVGDLPSADAAIEDFDRLTSEINEPRWRLFVEMLEAVRAFMEGQWAEGEQHAAAALELGNQSGYAMASNIFTAQLFPALLEQGKLLDLGPMLQVIESELGDLAAVRCALTFFTLEAGNRNEARERLDALAEKEFTDIPRDALWALCITFLARVASELDDSARASILYRLLAGYEGRMIVTEPLAVLCFGPAAHYLGILAATMGLTERALAHFEQALVVTTPPFRGHTYLARARVLAGRGEHDSGRADAAAALEIAQKLGMKYLEGKVEAFLNGLGDLGGT
jgi:tetratricopeptide (TPR) repeat protein